jgi:hypothetical protein
VQATGFEPVGEFFSGVIHRRVCRSATPAFAAYPQAFFVVHFRRMIGYQLATPFFNQKQVQVKIT